MPDVPAAGQQYRQEPDKDDFSRHGGHEGDDRHPGATTRYYSNYVLLCVIRLNCKRTM